jgi:hypothetical protein
MNKYQDAAIHAPFSNSSAQEFINDTNGNLANNESKTGETKKAITTKIAFVKSSDKKKWMTQFQPDSECKAASDKENKQTSLSNNILRLSIKNGEYVYARANDIIMIESCDHMVKVHLGIENKVKLTTRQNTLKDFLLKLPSAQFIRIGRFCAINIQRLSGGNCNKQTFEFDYKISIKPKHTVPNKIFSVIGN